MGLVGKAVQHRRRHPRCPGAGIRLLGLLMPFMMPMVKRQAGRGYENLKRVLESKGQRRPRDRPLPASWPSCLRQRSGCSAKSASWRQPTGATASGLFPSGPQDGRPTDVTSPDLHLGTIGEGGPPSPGALSDARFRSASGIRYQTARLLRITTCVRHEV